MRCTWFQTVVSNHSSQASDFDLLENMFKQAVHQFCSNNEMKRQWDTTAACFRKEIEFGNLDAKHDKRMVFNILSISRVARWGLTGQRWSTDPVSLPSPGNMNIDIASVRSVEYPRSGPVSLPSPDNINVASVRRAESPRSVLLVVFSWSEPWAFFSPIIWHQHINQGGEAVSLKWTIIANRYHGRWIWKTLVSYLLMAIKNAS